MIPITNMNPKNPMNLPRKNITAILKIYVSADLSILFSTMWPFCCYSFTHCLRRAVVYFVYVIVLKNLGLSNLLQNCKDHPDPHTLVHRLLHRM